MYFYIPLTKTCKHLASHNAEKHKQLLDLFSWRAWRWLNKGRNMSPWQVYYFMVYKIITSCKRLWSHNAVRHKQLLNLFSWRAWRWLNKGRNMSPWQVYYFMVYRRKILWYWLTCWLLRNLKKAVLFGILRRVAQRSIFTFWSRWFDQLPVCHSGNRVRSWNGQSDTCDGRGDTGTSFTPVLGIAVAQWLRCCATNWMVTGSIPAGVIGIFHWHNPADRTMALGSTQPLTEMSTRRISWG